MEIQRAILMCKIQNNCFSQIYLSICCLNDLSNNLIMPLCLIDQSLSSSEENCFCITLLGNWKARKGIGKESLTFPYAAILSY